MSRPDWVQTTPVPDITGKQKKSKKAKNAVKPIIHNVTLLDCSTSMQGEKHNAASLAIQSELRDLAQDDTATYKHTVACFTTEGYRGLKIEYPLYTASNTQCDLMRASGNTPLNDAILSLIKRIEGDVQGGENVVLKIYTDGEENASETKHEDVSKEITRLKAKDWVITFIGTEYDTQRAIRDYKIDASNTLVHQNTGASLTASFAVNTNSMRSYAKRVAKGDTRSLNFYDDSNK